MGVMSTMPRRGTTRRRGPRIGSVTSLRILTTGPRGSTGNQETAALAMIAI